MITKADSEIVNRIKMFIESDTNESSLARNHDWLETLDRLVSNLHKAPFSYRDVSAEDKNNNYYTVECSGCGWYGSSKLLDGGIQIADTGDYGNCYCPVCGEPDPAEKE